MCELFIGADPALWKPQTRSLRVDGVVTSIRLEQFFWNILSEIAKRDGMNEVSLISKLYLESTDAGHQLDNFTSFLRVCCGRYLSLVADQKIMRDHSSLRSITNVKEILRNERETK